MPAAVLEAPAKVNLSLEVVGRRADGFHELVSIMQAVALCDTLTIDRAEDIELTCSDPALAGPDNLVLRAARALQSWSGVTKGCSFHLEKRIPHAAGLGGGSSDAAAALVGLCRLWNLDPPWLDLVDLAASVGSDVPFFLSGGTALLEGRGERVTPLSPFVNAWFLLVKPPVTISTADVFRNLPKEDWTDGCRTRELERRICRGLPPELGINSLQGSVLRNHHEVRACFEQVASVVKPKRALLSGSGPTVFVMYGSRHGAVRAQKALRSAGVWTYVARALASAEVRQPCS